MTPVCDACGAEHDVMPYPHPDGHGIKEHLCPEHARSTALTLAAMHHLKTLVRGAVFQWAPHWQQAGMPIDDLTAAADMAISDLDLPHAEWTELLADILRT